MITYHACIVHKTEKYPYEWKSFKSKSLLSAKQKASSMFVNSRKYEDLENYKLILAYSINNYKNQEKFLCCIRDSLIERGDSYDNREKRWEESNMHTPIDEILG